MRISLTRPEHHLTRLSFPTRRSSDLGDASGLRRFRRSCPPAKISAAGCSGSSAGLSAAWARSRAWSVDAFPSPSRSEEHTSELQSHVNLVCRLLLDRKKGYLISDNDY